VKLISTAKQDEAHLVGQVFAINCWKFLSFKRPNSL